MIISVEQRHIDAGQRAIRNACPIANAAREALGAPVSADGFGVHLAEGGLLRINETTRLRMARYDRTGHMRPFRFRVKKLV